MKLFLLMAVAAVLAGWFGGPLVHPTSATSAPRPAWRRPMTTAIGPLALSSARLRAEARFLGQPIYWAGPAKGYRYELTRTTSNHLFVRYLPPGVRAGADGAHFIVVATYPFSEAYKSLKRIARGRGIVGPGGSFIFTRQHDARSVLLAFPRIPYEIEVYAPTAALAAAVARAGYVRPVG